MENLITITEEEMITEINNLVNILPNIDMFISNSHTKVSDLFKEEFNNIMNFLNSHDNYKAIYLSKIEFLEKIDKNQFFFSIEKLNIRLTSILTEYGVNKKKIKFISENIFQTFMSNYKVVGLNSSYYIEENKLNLNFNLNCENNYFNYITTFHELCHSLQEYFNKKDKEEIKENNQSSDQLNTQLINQEELKINKSKIKINQLKYLSTFAQESEANLFSNMLILLKILNLNSPELFQKYKNFLLFNSSSSQKEKGYFEFPSFFNEIRKIELNPQEYLLNFIDQSNQIDFKKLYFYIKNLILERQNKYKKFLFQHSDLDINDYWTYLNILPTQEMQKSIMKYKFSPILAENYLLRMYIIEKQKENENNINYHFLSLFLKIKENFKNKNLTIQFYENKLNLFQRNMQKENYDKLKNCVDSIINIYNTFVK